MAQPCREHLSQGRHSEAVSFITRFKLGYRAACGSSGTTDQAPNAFRDERDGDVGAASYLNGLPEILSPGNT